MMRAVKSTVFLGMLCGVMLCVVTAQKCGQANSCDPIGVLEADLASYKHDFDRDGFVVVRNYLSPDEIAEAFAHLAEIVSEPGPKKDLQKEDQWFDDLMERGRPRALVEAMVGGPVQSASAGYFDKPLEEHRFAEVAPHVDGLGKRDGATVWIALDRVTKENGALFYVNGSHLMNLTPESLASTSESSEGAFCAEVNPGDAIVHTARTIHFSRKAQTADPRRAMNFFYWTGLSNSAIALPYVDKQSLEGQKKLAAKKDETQDLGFVEGSPAWKKLVAQKEKMVAENRWQIKQGGDLWEKMVAKAANKVGEAAAAASVVE